MSRALGARDLALLAVGVTVSATGDSAAQVALVLRLRPDGSGWVAAVLAVEFLPAILFAAVVGRLVDRVESHRVLVLGLAGQAALSVPLAFAHEAWAVVVLFLAVSVFAVGVRPATSALIPVIAGEEHASGGYARVATGSSLGFIVGPVVGGVLTATLGTTAVLIIDAASFGVLALAAASIRARRPPAPTTAARTRADGGFALIWNSPVLRLALAASAIAIGCAVADNVAAPYRFIDQLGASATQYGAYLTLWGAGAFVGIQLIPRFSDRKAERLLAAGNLLIGVGIAAIGIAPTTTVALVASVVGGIGNGMSDVSQSTLVVTHTSPDQRGRVFAATGGIVRLALAIGTLGAAPLVSVLGAGHTMTLVGSAAATVAAFALSRALPRTPE